MKTKFFLIIVATCSLITSCKKTTYVCKDINNIETGEVKASSQDKANSMCPSGGHAEKK